MTQQWLPPWMILYLQLFLSIFILKFISLYIGTKNIGTVVHLYICTTVKLYMYTICILSNFCSLCLFHFHFQKTRKCWTGTCVLNFVRFSSIFLTWICLNVNLFTKIKNPKVEDEPKSTCRYKHLVKFTSWVHWIEWKGFLSFFIALIAQL